MAFIVAENGHFRNYENDDAQHSARGGKSVYLLTKQGKTAEWLEVDPHFGSNNFSVAAYSRTSYKKAGDGHSCKFQPAKLREFCTSIGFQVIEFSDFGHRGYKWDRPQFQEMKSAVLSGQVANVLVTRPSRLTRDSHHLYMIADWPCRIWSLNLEDAGKDIQRQTVFRAANDFPIGRDPLGKKLNSQTGKLEFDARDFQVYQEIQKWRAQDVCWADVCVHLNASGLFTKSGKRWSESNVKKFCARLENTYPEIVIWKIGHANDCTNGPRSFAGTIEAPEYRE